MPSEERTRWLVGLLVSVFLGMAALAWGGAQWLGNREHDVLHAKDTELEKRIDKVEQAIQQIPQIASDVAAIRGYIEGTKNR